MKAGILTFHRAVNYGATLQAYALYKVLIEQGCQTRIIDYRCKAIEDSVSPLDGLKKNGISKATVKQAIYRFIKKSKFDTFYKKYIDITKPIFTKDSLTELNNEFDVFITGSDQVWNWGCSGADETFFLDFVSDNRKKNSYAASFGMETIEKEDPFDYNKLLQGFNRISMREKSGANIIENVLGKLPTVNVDPTLLLKKDEWINIMGKRPLNKPYIFVYSIREPYQLDEYVNLLAEKTGCVVINPKRSKEFLFKCAPQDFLSWIYYADYVVTNSFHGTVFSVLFEKKFAVEISNKKSVNNRSKELLSMLNLADCIVDLDNLENIEKIIDFTAVKNILQKERNSAIAYLKGIVG